MHVYMVFFILTAPETARLSGCSSLRFSSATSVHHAAIADRRWSERQDSNLHGAELIEGSPIGRADFTVVAYRHPPDAPRPLTIPIKEQTWGARLPLLHSPNNGDPIA